MDIGGNGGIAGSHVFGFVGHGLVRKVCLENSSLQLPMVANLPFLYVHDMQRDIAHGSLPIQIMQPATTTTTTDSRQSIAGASHTAKLGCPHAIPIDAIK